MWNSFRSYTIHEGDLYKHQRDQINPDVRRMDEILEGVMWALGRNPQQFFQTIGRLWLVRTDPFPGAPPLRIWFKLELEAQTVELLSIERVEEDSI